MEKKHAAKLRRQPNSTRSLPPQSKLSTADDNATRKSLVGHKCTICTKKFESLQECLKHELLKHSAQNKRPQKAIRSKVNSLLKSFNDGDELLLQNKVRKALSNCKPGKELLAIFQYYRMNVDNLDMVCSRIVACLYDELKAISEQRKIYAFGSVATGLALRDSDIDLYVGEPYDFIDPNLPVCRTRSDSYHRSTFNKINNQLHRSQCFDDVIPIRQARVPIIKCKHKPTGFSLDINLSCPSSVYNSNFLRDVLNCDVRLNELMIFLKIWAKQLKLIGHGKMTSYCLITLVIFYMQQSQPKQPALIPPIKTLQKDIEPIMILGVNYAYNLTSCEFMRPLPKKLKVLDLIKGFFAFYKQFNFEKLIIAPYLGRALPLEQFKASESSYREYHSQLRAITILHDSPADTLQVERCMCVQDPFCLNHNVAKSMTPPNLEYFRKCLQYAGLICEDKEIKSSAKLYEALLYDIIEQIARAVELEKIDQSLNSSNNLPNKLNYRFTPCRTEIRALAIHSQITDRQKLNDLWVKKYIEVITEIITEIYGLEMQSASPTHRGKHQRLEHSDRTHTWLLSGSVDLWTGRLHQRRSNQSFMDYQREQTKAFQNNRRQNSTYSVQLSALLTLNIIYDSTAIELIVTPRESKAMGLCKKDPIRKFFTMFKCSMQNFNVKEKLLSETNCKSDFTT